MSLELKWYKRDDGRTAYGLKPDGLWNAECPYCDSSLAGIEATHRVGAELAHLGSCGHKKLFDQIDDMKRCLEWLRDEMKKLTQADEEVLKLFIDEISETLGDEPTPRLGS